MKPYRFSTDSYMTATNPFCSASGTVFANTIEEAQQKVKDEYGVSAYVCEYDNDIIADSNIR